MSAKIEKSCLTVLSSKTNHSLFLQTGMYNVIYTKKSMPFERKLRLGKVNKNDSKLLLLRTQIVFLVLQIKTLKLSLVTHKNSVLLAGVLLSHS